MPKCLICNADIGIAQGSGSSGNDFCQSCGSPLWIIDDQGRLNGRYKIIKELGRGGMGAVYFAIDTKYNSECAVKIQKMPLDPQENAWARERFETEALLLHHLQHPQLPQVFDHDINHVKGMLVMTYIPGETLEELVCKNGALSEEKALKYATQTCDVLEVLHAKNIIHRDIKPSNLKVNPEDLVKLLDFGIARTFNPNNMPSSVVQSASAGNGKSLKSNMTRMTRVGTHGYAAPEMYQGIADERSDIYGLGATMFALLTATAPNQLIVKGELRSKMDDPNFLPAELEIIVEKAYSLNPEDRYQTAVEFRDAMEDYITNKNNPRPVSTQSVLGQSGYISPAASGRTSAKPKNLGKIATLGKLIAYALAGPAVIFGLIVGGMHLDKNSAPLNQRKTEIRLNLDKAIYNRDVIQCNENMREAKGFFSSDELNQYSAKVTLLNLDALMSVEYFEAKRQFQATYETAKQDMPAKIPELKNKFLKRYLIEISHYCRDGKDTESLKNVFQSCIDEKIIWDETTPKMATFKPAELEDFFRRVNRYIYTLKSLKTSESKIAIDSILETITDYNILISRVDLKRRGDDASLLIDHYASLIKTILLRFDDNSEREIVLHAFSSLRKIEESLKCKNTEFDSQKALLEYITAPQNMEIFFKESRQNLLTVNNSSGSNVALDKKVSNNSKMLPAKENKSQLTAEITPGRLNSYLEKLRDELTKETIDPKMPNKIFEELFKEAAFNKNTSKYQNSRPQLTKLLDAERGYISRPFLLDLESGKEISGLSYNQRTMQDIEHLLINTERLLQKVAPEKKATVPYFLELYAGMAKEKLKSESARDNLRLELLGSLIRLEKKFSYKLKIFDVEATLAAYTTGILDKGFVSKRYLEDWTGSAILEEDCEKKLKELKKISECYVLIKTDAPLAKQHYITTYFAFFKQKSEANDISGFNGLLSEFMNNSLIWQDRKAIENIKFYSTTKSIDFILECEIKLVKSGEKIQGYGKQMFENTIAFAERVRPEQKKHVVAMLLEAYGNNIYSELSGAADLAKRNGWPEKKDYFLRSLALLRQLELKYDYKIKAMNVEKAILQYAKF